LFCQLNFEDFAGLGPSRFPKVHVTPVSLIQKQSPQSITKTVSGRCDFPWTKRVGLVVDEAGGAQARAGG